jgi:phasin family protein
MSTFPEQFSAAGKSQVEAQLAFFQNVTAKAVEGAEKIIALNLTTGRASVEKSTAAMRQLLTVRDPRDLLAFTTHSQENFDTLLAYGRELFTIASGTQAAMLKTPAPAPQEVQALAAPVVKVAEQASEPVEPALADSADDLAADLADEQLELIAAKPRRSKK